MTGDAFKIKTKSFIYFQARQVAGSKLL